MSAYGDFPRGTVHVAVVDPGVGGPRRGVAIQLPEGYLVGPDNGLFSGVLHRSSPQGAVELTQAKWWRTPDPSSTFHGRDIFAPVAAHLAQGVSLDQLGDPIPLESLVQLPILPVQTTDTGLQGSIQYIDHFGNLITTIPAERVQGRTWQIQTQTIIIPSGQTFGAVTVGDLLGLIGSQGWVEIAVNRGSAQDRLGLRVGDLIQLEFIS